MILLRLSTFYVEILIVANIIFKIINKSHNFFYTLDKTGCKCRPSHRHTYEFPAFYLLKIWSVTLAIFGIRVVPSVTRRSVTRESDVHR